MGVIHINLVSGLPVCGQWIWYILTTLQVLIMFPEVKELKWLLHNLQENVLHIYMKFLLWCQCRWYPEIKEILQSWYSDIWYVYSLEYNVPEITLSLYLLFHFEVPLHPDIAPCWDTQFSLIVLWLVLSFSLFQIVHFVNRDSLSLANDFLSLGFIPEGVDIHLVSDALQASFSDDYRTSESQDFQVRSCFIPYVRINCLLGNSCNWYYILVISLNLTKQRVLGIFFMSIERLGRK
jgi:hypothetical protein